MVYSFSIARDFAGHIHFAEVAAHEKSSILSSWILRWHHDFARAIGVDWLLLEFFLHIKSGAETKRGERMRTALYTNEP